MPVTIAPHAGPLCTGGQISQRRITLEKILPWPADLGDLAEVVHYIYGVKTGGLRRRGHPAKDLACSRRAARKSKRPDM